MLKFWRRSLGLLALIAALTGQQALAQVATPDVPDAPAPPKPPAVKAEADAAVDAPKPAPARAADAAADTPREAAREAATDTREAARETTEEARDTAKGARREARDASRDARETGRDVRETVRDTRRDARQDARSVDIENLRAADIGLWFNARGAAADGLVIADIAGDGAIAKVGFREGDRIVSVNDQRVASEAEFLRFLRDDTLRDQRVKVIVFRGGREQIVYIQPALIYREAVAFDPLWQYGLVIDERYNDRIVVMRVYPRTPAYYAGLRAGDVIVSLGGRRIGAVTELADAFRAPDGRVALQVSRGNRTRDVEIDANANVEARTTLRPNVDGETRIDGRGRIEAREGSVDQPGGTRTRIEKQRPNQPASRPRLGSDPEDATPAPPAERVPAEKPTVEKPGEKPAVPALVPGEPAVAPPAAGPKAPRVPRTP
jgi:type II secretory pathway component PulC